MLEHHQAKGQSLFVQRHACLMVATKQIEGSFKDDGDALHISILVQRVFPKGVPSTTEHWMRIAFLVSISLFPVYLF
jgi:hypothetical protein